MADKVKKLTPENISDVREIDADSGLRKFRGMITPWDQIKSFKETFTFMIRHAAMHGVAYLNAFKIIEPDYETRLNTMSKCWGDQMKYTWDKVNDPVNAIKHFEERYDIPPFLEQGLYRSACFVDQGDELMLMPGYIWYASNDRIEKEIHRCDLDIMGPDACDLSNGGGCWFCRGIADVDFNNMLSQRKGCGDPYCHAHHETYKKYGENPLHKTGHDWEMWGPGFAPLREHDQHKHKDECEFLSTDEYMTPLGALFTAGDMYNMSTQMPLNYSAHAVSAMRVLVPEEKLPQAYATVNVMFDTAGKMQFAEWNTRKAAREWLGVPPDVDDGRVLGGYISMILQARNVPWSFIEFSEERTIVECDRASLIMFNMYPEFIDSYRAYFDGMAKTLVNTQWVVKLAEDAPEGKVRYVIEKGLYGYRRQKPGYTFEKKTCEEE